MTLEAGFLLGFLGITLTIVGFFLAYYYGRKENKEVKYEDYVLLQSTPLLKPTSNRPQWCRADGKIYMSHVGSNGNSVNYIKTPVKAEWNSLGTGLYVEGVDFELHPSEETKLVIKILGLAGITLKDPGLYQIAGAEDNKSIQQEKQ